MTDEKTAEPAPDGLKDDPVEAVKADIEATRAGLQETVDELSDRLNPKTQLRHAAESVTQTTKRTATQAGSAAKHSAAQAQTIAHNQVGRVQRAGRGRRGQAGLLAGTVAVIGLVWWRTGRRSRC